MIRVLHSILGYYTLQRFFLHLEPTEVLQGIDTIDEATRTRQETHFILQRSRAAPQPGRNVLSFPLARCRCSVRTLNYVDSESSPPRAHRSKRWNRIKTRTRSEHEAKTEGSYCTKVTTSIRPQGNLSTFSPPRYTHTSYCILRNQAAVEDLTTLRGKRQKSCLLRHLKSHHRRHADRDCTAEEEEGRCRASKIATRTCGL